MTGGAEFGKVRGVSWGGGGGGSRTKLSMHGRGQEGSEKCVGWNGKEEGWW